jgi:radical SAM-linked protein
MRVRVRFSKTGKVRFTSHRDVARIWERALRRAALPVKYTEGFSPRPKLSFGLALPTGSESLGEYLDVELRSGGADADVAVEQLPALLDGALPAGMEVQAAVALPPGSGSLQQLVTSCTWRIELVGIDAAALDAAVERACSAAILPLARERKGQTTTDDVRPAILALDVEGCELVTELATQPRGLRPSELAAVIAPGIGVGRVVRTHQWTLVDGARREPLELPAGIGATSTPHAEERA